MAEEPQIKEPEKGLHKFSVIPKFFNPTSEIESDELVMSHDVTGKVYVHFIDVLGRLWIGALDDFVVIRNFPSKIDLDNFCRLKYETKLSEEQFEKQLTQKPAHDMAVG